MRTGRARPWGIVCASLACVLLAGPARAGEPVRVVVSEAALLSFPLTVEALGTARANESVDVRPQTSERVTAIRFTEGETVEAGRVLVELEDTEARADVAAARAELVDSEDRLRRARQLRETGALSDSELAQRVAQRDADRAALDASLARLADTVIRAPFEGRVGLRRVSVGSVVTPDTVITTLDDTDPIKLDFDVPETALALLAEALPVVAHSAAWPDEVFTGRVASIDTRVDPVSRTVTVRALVPNDAQRLRPGMFLTVELVRENVAALMVPEQAIVPEQSRQFVWVVVDGVASRREVLTGRRRGGQVEVREGLAAGDLVIAEGTQKVRAGDPVEIVERRAVAAEAP